MGMWLHAMLSLGGRSQQMAVDVMTWAYMRHQQLEDHRLRGIISSRVEGDVGLILQEERVRMMK